MIPSWTTDPFAVRTTLHGLASDEVRSALHKHVRLGRVEQAVRAAVELARTDDDHEAMLWQRLRVIAAEDVGLGTPVAPAVVAALHQSVGGFPPGAFERLEMAAQAAAYLASAPKDPTASEILQLVLHDDRRPDIPDEAICVHTRRGQEQGRTVVDWWEHAARVEPEAPGRDRSWREALSTRYRVERDPGT